jgi:hypothetical protein
VPFISLKGDIFSTTLIWPSFVTTTRARIGFKTFGLWSSSASETDNNSTKKVSRWSPVLANLSNLT